MDNEENQYVRAMRRKLIESKKTIEELRHKLSTIESRHLNDLAMVKFYANGLKKSLDHLFDDPSISKRE